MDLEEPTGFARTLEKLLSARFIDVYFVFNIKKVTLSDALDCGLNMADEPLSRRAVIGGFGCVLASRSALAQASSAATAPPFLQTNHSQFIEMRPAVRPPALRIERIDGALIELNAFLGKAVLLNFWATWCPPCRRELPQLDRLRQLIRPEALAIVAVAIDAAGRPAVASFLKRSKITHLQAYLDPQGRVAKRIGEDGPSPFVLYGMPISYVIDRQGLVAGYITDEVDWTSADALSLLRYYMAG